MKYVLIALLLVLFSPRVSAQYDSYLHTAHFKDTITWTFTDSLIMLYKYTPDIREATEVVASLPIYHTYTSTDRSWNIKAYALKSDREVRIYYNKNTPVYIVWCDVIHRILP